MFLRALGIEITFSREGRAGNRVMRMRATTENTVSTIGSVSEYEPWLRTASTGDFCDNNARRDRLARGPSGSAASQTPWCGKGQPWVTD
jgi:prevent-host-death family protein